MRKSTLFLAGLVLLVLLAIPFTRFAAFQKDQEEFDKELRESDAKLRYIEEAIRQEVERTKSPLTGNVPRQKLIAAQQYLAERAAIRNERGLRAINGINWVERGPTNVGGRTRALLFDLNDLSLNKVYAGAVDGGLWVCNNISAQPATWTKVSDGFDNLAVTTIAQQASNPNNMYFGTGEGFFNVDAVQGLGIWRSTDNGATWQHLPSTVNGQFQSVQKIVVAANGDVYAATTPGGILRSRNGGITWEQVLAGGSGADIEIASTGQLWASIGLFSPGSVWTSLTGDPGSWSQKTPANPATGGMRRIEIAVAPSDPNTVYLLGHDGNSNDCNNIWYTANGGTNWTLRAAPTGTDQVPTAPNFTRGQAWYDLTAAVDPNNPQTLIIGGIDLHKSINAGATWIHLTKWYNSLLGAFPTLPVVHADQHAIVFKPFSSSSVLFGNDGGVYYTTNMSPTVTQATPATYVSKNNGYNVTQFYAVAAHPTNPDYFLAGAQDNGTQRFTGGAGAQATTEATGGDGAFCHIDALNPANQFTSYVYSSFYRSTNGGNSFSNTINNTAKGSFINPSDYDNASKYLFYDYTDVATRVGGVYGRWNTTTSSETGITVPTFSGGSVTHVLVSPNVANRVYFGLSNGRVVYVDNAHTTATPATGTLVRTGQGSVSGIAIEPGNENHMLVTYSNYDVGSVFETTDGGANWTALEGNLPNMPVRWVVFNPNNFDQAFLATELGVWSTDDLNGAATEWNPTNGGLANCRVDMLQISGNQMVAATHGRGLFTTSITGGANNAPAIHFQFPNTAGGEANPATPLSCGRGYRDYPVRMFISAAPTGTATVNLSVVPNTATAVEGQDFDIMPKTLTFTSGSSAAQTFNVRVYNDAAVEAEQEFFTIDYTISGATNAVKNTSLQTLDFRIEDDDYLNVPHGPTTVFIKSGIYNTNLGGSSPLQGSQSDKKMQFLYRKDELLAMGLKPGSITSLSFLVGTKGSTLPYNGMTILMGAVPTSVNNLSGGFVSTSGFTTVYSAPSPGYNTVAGENRFTMNTPFNWDGNSNLVVQFCYDNLAAPPAAPVALPVGSPDDILQGEQDPQGLVNQVRAVSTNVPTDNGCNFTVPTITNIFRPILLFGQPVPETPVQTILNRSKDAYLGPNEDVYFYDQTDGRLLARIQNLSSIDYGCTRVEIDRQAGPQFGSPFFTNTPAGYVTTKSFRILPAQNGTATGNFRVTIYYTAAEKSGWESVTGLSWNNTNMVKVSGGLFVPNISPSSPSTSNVTTRPMTPGSVGTSFSASASFTSSLAGGFAVGTPDVSNAPLPTRLITFGGKLMNDHARLSWTMTDEDNRGYDVEHSADGRKFQVLGRVAAQSGSGPLTYSFTDPRVAGAVQYYRLSMIRPDGKGVYSNVVRLQKNSLGIGVQVYPTVTRGPVTLDYSEARNEAVVVDVTSAQGARMLQRRGSMQDGSLDLQGLAAGTYTITITVPRTGEVLATTRVIRQ